MHNAQFQKQTHMRMHMQMHMHMRIAHAHTLYILYLNTKLKPMSKISAIKIPFFSAAGIPEQKEEKKANEANV